MCIFTSQVHQHEVQGRHVHRLVFPQLLFRRRLLRRLLLQKLHLCRLFLLQHWWVYTVPLHTEVFFLPPQENPIMLSLPYTYVSLSLPLTDHFGSNVRAPGEERMGLSIYGFCFMPLNCCLTSVTPHRLPFWTQTTLVNTETEPGWAAVDCKWWFLTTETLLGGWVRKPKHEISEQLNFNFAVTVQPRHQHQVVPLLFWVIAGCI